MSLSRVHRLVRLITLLQSRPGIDAEELMEELGVARRTLFRDFLGLKDAGIPVFHEKGKGYRLAEGFFLPPINLEHVEVIGLLLLGRIAAADRSRPMTGPALSAIRKLVAAMPAEVREVAAGLIDTVDITADRSPTDGAAESRWYGVLQSCVDEGRACGIAYRAAADGQPLETELHPYVLHFVNRAWYVLGWSAAHDEVRVFKLVRFEAIEPNAVTFERPRGVVEAKLGNAWQLIPGGKEYDVELEFTAKVARNVVEVRWHRTQSHRLLKDGRARVRFRVDGVDEVAWWVCGYADQVKVLKPAALRERVRSMHAAALARYEAP